MSPSTHSHEPSQSNTVPRLPLKFDFQCRAISLACELIHAVHSTFVDNFVDHSDWRDPFGRLRTFILSSTFPRYTFRTVKSTTTHPYKRAGQVLEARDVPYFLKQDNSLVDRMAEDLERRILPKFSSLADRESFKYALSRYERLLIEARTDKITLARGAFHM